MMNYSFYWNRVQFDPYKDQLYLTGDLVARGDKSLECLRFVKSLGEAGKNRVRKS